MMATWFQGKVPSSMKQCASSMKWLQQNHSQSFYQMISYYFIHGLLIFFREVCFFEDVEDFIKRYPDPTLFNRQKLQEEFVNYQMMESQTFQMRSGSVHG